MYNLIHLLVIKESVLQDCVYIMQVLAACLYPQLVNSSKLPADIRQRAQRLLGRCDGGSVGKGRASGIAMNMLKSQLAQITKLFIWFTAIRAESFFFYFAHLSQRLMPPSQHRKGELNVEYRAGLRAL